MEKDSLENFCVSLGEITQKLDNTKYYLSCTFTVPSKLRLKDYKYKQYDVMTPQEQKILIYDKIKLWYMNEEVSKIIKSKLIIHYETHKNGNIHAHAKVEIHETMYKYKVHLITLNKVWMQIIKGNRLSSVFKYIDIGDEEKIEEYINKENIFTPDEVTYSILHYIDYITN